MGKKLANKNLFLIFLFVFLGLTAAHAASAHFYLTDGSITVLLHMDPDDDPIVGQPATIHFQITDKTNKFTPANCDCSVIVSEYNGPQILSSSLSAPPPPSIYEFGQKIIFPIKDIYLVTMTGQPKKAGEFSKFKVVYDFRIDRESGAPAAPLVTNAVVHDHTNHLGHIVILTGGIIVGTILYIRDRRRRGAQNAPAKKALTK